MTPPKANRALAEMVPGAQLEVIEGAGHMMMLESPNETLATFRAFLEA
jgi:pimeloyl-ACP methyl ester carboxylesterase